MNYEFTTTILQGDRGGAYVLVPVDTLSAFGTRGRVKVAATFDGTEYRGSIAPMAGGHVLGVTKAIRAAIGKDIGDEVHVTLTKDDKQREVDVPPELDKALKLNPVAGAKFENLAYTYRKEFAKWIKDSKREETRERRLKKAIQIIINDEKL